MTVVGFGEASVDHVHVVPELPGPAMPKTPIVERFVSYGGQVATTMAACAALGLEARFLGPVGNDASADGLLDELAARGVDVGQVVRRDASTRFAVILVHRSTGDRYVLWRRDERLDVPPGELPYSVLSSARVVHVDATDPPASLALARRAIEIGARVTTDVDAVTTDTVALLSASTTPIVAEHVPRELTGESDLEQALRRMRQPHQPIVCVTLGERGSAALAGDTFVQAPAHHVDAVDTTGAGDVFRAGFIYGLLHGFPIERLLRFANETAADACTRRGAIGAVRRPVHPG